MNDGPADVEAEAVEQAADDVVEHDRDQQQHAAHEGGDAEDPVLDRDRDHPWPAHPPRSAPCGALACPPSSRGRLRQHRAPGQAPEGRIGRQPRVAGLSAGCGGLPPGSVSRRRPGSRRAHDVQRRAARRLGPEADQRRARARPRRGPARRPRARTGSPGPCPGGTGGLPARCRPASGSAPARPRARETSRLELPVGGPHRVGAGGRLARLAHLAGEQDDDPGRDSAPRRIAIRRRVRPATGRSARLPERARGGGRRGGDDRAPARARRARRARGSRDRDRRVGRGIEPRVASLDSAVNPNRARRFTMPDG